VHKNKTLKTFSLTVFTPGITPATAGAYAPDYPGNSPICLNIDAPLIAETGQ
jgi:hypothetical protein